MEKYNAPVVSKPDAYVPESEKDAEYHANAVRYYTQKYYNFNFYSFNDNVDQNSAQYYRSVIDKIIENWSYYLGKQDMGVASILLNDYVSRGVYSRGSDIYMLVEHMVGRMSKIINNIKLSSELLSKNAQTQKEFLQDIILMQVQYGSLFNILNTAGVFIQALPDGIEIETEEEFYRIKEDTLKSRGEIIAVQFADKMWYYNNLSYLYEEVVRQCVVAGLCGVDNYTVNGLVKKELVQGHQLIWDNTKTDKYNSQAQCAGRVFYRLTANEVISKWGNQLTDTEINEIKTLSTGSMEDLIGAYNTVVNGSNLWYDVSSNSVTGIGAVKMYWRDYKDHRLLDKGTRVVKIQDFDANGNPIKKNVGKRGDYGHTVWRTATLIANKYVVDYGVCTNLVYDPIATSEPLCPLQIVVPSATLDQYRSQVNRVIDLQKQIDFYSNKVYEMSLRAIGKSYYINGKALGIENPEEFFKDLKVQNVTFGVPDGEDSSDIEGKRISVETIDLTLDPNVMKYVELAKEKKQEMKEALSLPDVSLGLQPVTIGKAVQENSIEVSSAGLTSFYNTILNFIQRDMQLAVNMRKLVAYQDLETAEQEIGWKGVNWLKMTPDYAFEPLGIYLKIQDIIDEKERAGLLNDAYAALQGGLIDFEDILNIRTARTYSEAKKSYEYGLKKKKREAAAIAEQQAAQEDAMKAADTATQLEKANITKQGMVEAADKRKQATENAAKESADAKKYVADRASATDIQKSIFGI